ncbi:MAG: hypothetical protein N4A38_05370 [Candidatus Gracilibacteria bacterium]|jgi:hypothetical protein|nr:hypothetical protein [Candidatus Gracilibacteria bacterium]
MEVIKMRIMMLAKAFLKLPRKINVIAGLKRQNVVESYNKKEEILLILEDGSTIWGRVCCYACHDNYMELKIGGFYYEGVPSDYGSAVLVR